jgi:hypothetical protein
MLVCGSWLKVSCNPALHCCRSDCPVLTGAMLCALLLPSAAPAIASCSTRSCRAARGRTSTLSEAFLRPQQRQQQLGVRSAQLQSAATHAVGTVDGACSQPACHSDQQAVPAFSSWGSFVDSKHNATGAGAPMWPVHVEASFAGMLLALAWDGCCQWRQLCMLCAAPAVSFVYSKFRCWSVLGHGVLV